MHREGNPMKSKPTGGAPRREEWKEQTVGERKREKVAERTAVVDVAGSKRGWSRETGENLCCSYKKIINSTVKLSIFFLCFLCI